MADTRDVIIADASAVPLPPPSLASGEDAAAYAQLAASIRAAVAPANIIEEIWARDVADLTWDVVRLRRLKAGLYTIGTSDGIAEVMRGLERNRLSDQINRRLPNIPFLRNIADDYAGGPGSLIYRRLQNGEASYRLFCFANY